MSLRLHNMFPPIGDSGSALWGIVELPGVVLHRYPSTSAQSGWRLELWDDFISPQSRWVLEKIRDQVFPTRKESLQAIELLMDMYPGEPD